MGVFLPIAIPLKQAYIFEICTKLHELSHACLYRAEYLVHSGDLPDERVVPFFQGFRIVGARRLGKVALTEVVNPSESDLNKGRNTTQKKFGQPTRLAPEAGTEPGGGTWSIQVISLDDDTYELDYEL